MRWQISSQYNHLCIFGTSSDAGKSTLAFVLAKLLQKRGLSVAPFKAQNVSNNSKVGDDGSEIAIAQFFAAEILNFPTTYHINPVLLKSGKGNSSSLIIEGKPCGEKDVIKYYRDLDTLKPIVSRSLEYLTKRYQIVVAEGAGSPVELNLMDKDLSNIYTARELNGKIILVADIEKGGVFASIWGVYNLLPTDLRENVIGVIVNKFRGDMTLFDEGVRIIEEQFKIPVLGVLPYTPFNFAYEDLQSINNYVQKSDYTIKVGVIKLPHISNFTDFEPLIIDDNISLEFITSNLSEYDAIIIPGSKRVTYDLSWLQEMNLERDLKKYKGKIFGICGGYELLHNNILDPDSIEGNSSPALGFFDFDVTFKKEKVLKKGIYQQFGLELSGYEIHHGISEKEFYQKNHISGTFLHGIFENDNFRDKFFQEISSEYKPYIYKEKREKLINEFLNVFDEKLDMKRVIETLKISD